MKFKLVPPPRSLETVERAQQALPLVPKPEEDCVARLLDALALRSRDQARTWLTFLRALGLAGESTTGFRRTRADPDRETLAERFREHIYGAEDVLTVLEEADEPLTADAVYDRFTVPKWERDRHTDPDEVWRERVDHILGWLVELGAIEHEDGTYRR